MTSSCDELAQAFGAGHTQGWIEQVQPQSLGKDLAQEGGFPCATRPKKKEARLRRIEKLSL